MDIVKVYPQNGNAATLKVVLTQQDIDNLNNGNTLVNDKIMFGGSEDDELPINVEVVKHIPDQVQ